MAYSKTSLSNKSLLNLLEHGKYRNLLNSIWDGKDPNIMIFDYVFPGFWNSAASKKYIQPQGDPKNIILSLVSKIFNIICDAKIQIQITFDDFQVCVLNYFKVLEY